MWNMFEFDMRLFSQIIGTAMGTTVATTFACLFKGEIDKLIIAAVFKGATNYIHFYKRFIDYILIIWLGTEKKFLTVGLRCSYLIYTLSLNCGCLGLVHSKMR